MNEPSGRDLLSPEYVAAQKTGHRTGFILAKIVWAGALLVMAFSAIDGFVSFNVQTGAPQQAAVAAYGCFRLIAVYVLARAVEALTRAERIRVEP
jgi:hypothetical protein